MSTLTQHTALVPDHCAHKLPTSCRLTARPICCACQDTRPHASSYRKYIDGVGYVMLGTRQDGYCWPCKVFWDTRTAAARMDPGQARIPFIPDQTNFVNAWHDWHRGFRILILDSGSETIQHLSGQPLNEVLIGHLPIPIDGGSSYDFRAVKWIVVPDIPVDLFPRQQEEVSIPDEDRLFDSDEESGSDQTTSNQNPTNNNSTSESNNQASMTTSTESINSNDLFHARNLRSILQRLNSLSSLISSTSVRLQHFLNLPEFFSEEDYDLRLIIEELRIMADNTAQQARRLTLHERILRSLRRNAPEDPSTQPPGASSLDVNPSAGDPTQNHTNTTAQQSSSFAQVMQPETVRNRVNRNTAITERTAIALGTREEVQQPDYESPISLMFDRQFAWRERVERQQEAQRRADENQQRILTALRRQIIRRMTSNQPSRQSSQQPSRELSTSPQNQLQAVQSTFGNNEDTNVLTATTTSPYSPNTTTTSSSPANEVGNPIDGRAIQNTTSQRTNSPEIQAIVTSLRRLVMSQLRELLPFPEDISRQVYEQRLEAIIVEYSESVADLLSQRTRDSSYPANQSGNQEIQRLIQNLLESVYPRQSGESLMVYMARIGLENTRRSLSPFDSQAQEQANRSREGTGQRFQATPIVARGINTDAQRTLERYGRGQAATLRPFEPPARPLGPSETMVQLQCVVCLEQIADIALVPCGHLVMCRWCSEKHAASTEEHHGQRVAILCPICRQRIKQRLRIWGLGGDRKEGGGAGRKDGMEGEDGSASGTVIRAA